MRIIGVMRVRRSVTSTDRRDSARRYGSRGVSSPPPPISVVEAMGASAFYPGAPEVVERETHSAWVFLADERAYKVETRADGVSDFSTLERRRAVSTTRSMSIRRSQRR